MKHNGRAGPSIGILGGSFNPPHAGHLEISQVALRRLVLREVWWLVSPGNPLKAHGELKSFPERVSLAEALIDHPAIRVSHFEHDRGLVHTWRTIEVLRQVYPDMSFVWIMGADNLATFHRWSRWRWIIESVPLAVFDRPGYRQKALSSPAARAYEKSRVDETLACGLAERGAPAWMFLTGPSNPLSSTSLRKMQETGRFSVNGRTGS